MAYRGLRMVRRGEPPSEPTVARLRWLIERQRGLHAGNEQALDDLAVAVVRAAESEQVSFRQIAIALGVSPATVQGWVSRGRQVLERHG